ncbi:hypothetical protein LXL04_038870 [Taraxacum kok-saghyz]
MVRVLSPSIFHSQPSDDHRFPTPFFSHYLILHVTLSLSVLLYGSASTYTAVILITLTYSNISSFLFSLLCSKLTHSNFQVQEAVRVLISAGETKESVCSEETIGTNEKLCVDCKTSKTPLWRSGPAGPKTLCNACGIRYRKKKSPIGSDKKVEKQPPSPASSPSSSSCSTSAAACTDEDAGMRKKLRINLVAVGKEVVVLQRRRSRMMKKVKGENIEKEYRKLGEVEEAAFLLISLSCGGAVFG